MKLALINLTYRQLTFILIAFTALVRFFLIAYTGLGTGEAYYFRGVLEPQLSYFDQPPLFFWIGWVSTQLMGLSAFALRLPGLLFFAGTTWLMFLVGKRLFSEAAGFYAAVIMNLSAVFTLSAAIWFQPDPPLMFFWMLSIYFLIEILFPKNGQQPDGLMPWVWVGVAMGFTALTKYHILFLLIGVLLFFSFNKPYRKYIVNPGVFLALALILILCIPVLIWNSQHDWVSFLFQGSRAARGKFMLHFDWFIRSFGGQSLWVLPWIWIPLFWQLFRTFRLGKTSAPYSFIFWISILPIAFFTLITLWSNLGFHFHWQAPGYMSLFLALGDGVDQWIKQGGPHERIARQWMRASAAFTFLSLTVLAIHLETGFWKIYGPKWFGNQFGVKDDPTMEAYDFDDLRSRFEEEGWMNNDHLFVSSTKWWFAGKVDWAMRGEKPLLFFHPDARNHAYFMKPKLLIGNDAIIVGKDHQKIVDHFVAPFFDEVVQLKPVAITRGGETEFFLDLYYARNFHKPDSVLNIPVYHLLEGGQPFNNRFANYSAK